MNNIIKEIKETINNETVVIAVSTGVDSMVLLDILQKATKNIIVAHCNHQQRIESIKEENFIKEYCDSLNIPCIIKTLEFENHQNFQNTARQKRYDFFKEVMNKYNASYLITAHHANDDLETIIMRFLKKSSLKGYAGIEKLSRVQNIYIYRPLLNITKSKIYEYALNNNIKYFHDKSNDEDEYLRNKIRHHIAKEIENLQPNFNDAIMEFKTHILNANNIIETHVNNFINNEVTTHNNITSFKISSFQKESSYLQEQILFTILKPFSLSKKLITELIKQINEDKQTINNVINNELLFVKEYGFIRFTKYIEKKDFELLIDKEGTYTTDLFKIFVDKNICYFETENNKLCYNNIDLPIKIRYRKPKDKIQLIGITKNLSDYLTNKKVPFIVRDNLLVVLNRFDIVLFLIDMIGGENV